MRPRHVVVVVLALAAAAIATTAAAVVPTHHHGNGHDQRTSRLIRQIRTATDDFHNIATAEKSGYKAFSDLNGISCIDDPDMGAMGVHFVNGDLVGDPTIDAKTPEALVYAPDRDGTLRLAALEYIVPKVAWDATHARAPELFHGVPFSVTTAPNRYGLPTFYSQHVWAWKANAAGLLAMWNPAVHCDQA